MSVAVPVPEGMEVGDVFNFLVPDGREFSLTVPDGAVAGQQIAVEVPTEAAAPPAPVAPAVPQEAMPTMEAPPVPFPLLVDDAPPAPPAPRPPSRYAQGMDMPTADMGEVEVPQADLSLLSRVEEAPATRLPSFDDFLRKSSSAPAQPDDGFASKLPAINQGKPGYIERDDGKSPFERFITRGTWTAIFILVAIEIFINTPAFQQLKPIVLKFLGDE